MTYFKQQREEIEKEIIKMDKSSNEKDKQDFHIFCQNVDTNTERLLLDTIDYEKYKAKLQQLNKDENAHKKDIEENYISKNVIINLNIEELADLEHQQWIKWSKELSEKESLSPQRVYRWRNECWKPYSELTEEMKEFDREWARKVIEIFKQELGLNSTEEKDG